MVSLQNHETNKEQPDDKKKLLWLVVAFYVLFIIMMIPFDGLSVAGHKSLAIVAFAVIVWVTECVSYALSAFIICALITFLIGFSPDPMIPGKLIGLSGAFKMAFSGWVEEMVWFMMGGLIIALSMNITGLDRRIALWIVSRFRTTKGVLLGTMIAMAVLAFFIPPIAARTAAMVPIIVGIIGVFDQPLNSRLASYLGVGMAIMGNTSAFGLLSGGSMNPLVASFVENATGISVGWMQWLLWFYPYTIIMTIALYFVLNWRFKPEVNEVPGGQAAIQKMYDELGEWTDEQKRLLVLTLLTIFCWAANGVLFKLNLTAITLVAIIIFMFPGIGVIDWNTVQKRLPWGTLMLFATGIALGLLLLRTKAAIWLANTIFGMIGLSSMGVLAATLVLSIIGIVMHLGFSSATALCATYIPIAIAYIQESSRTDLSLIGIPLIILIATGLTILVVNTPNTMIAFGSGTFTTKDFIFVGVTNAIIGLIMIIIFTMSYWHWVGIV